LLDIGARSCGAARSWAGPIIEDRINQMLGNDRVQNSGAEHSWLKTRVTGSSGKGLLVAGRERDRQAWYKAPARIADRLKSLGCQGVYPVGDPMTFDGYDSEGLFTSTGCQPLRQRNFEYPDSAPELRQGASVICKSKEA
jgi:hypothetical protein